MKPPLLSGRNTTMRVVGAITLALTLWSPLAYSAANLARPSDSSLAKQIEAYRSKPGALSPVALFEPSSQSITQYLPDSHALTQGSILTLDASALARLHTQDKKTMTLALPQSGQGVVELELFRQELFAPGFRITASDGEDTRRLKRGRHYRGIVKNEPGSFAAISIFGNEVMGTFASDRRGTWVLGRLNNVQGGEGQHVFYAESQLKDKTKAPKCMMPTPDPTRSGRHISQASPRAAAVNTADCASLWLEAEYDIFQRKGSLQAVTDYMLGVFNNVSTLYANDGINLQLTQLYIWTAEDPYNGSDTGSNLMSFQTYRANSFTGTIAQLMTFRPLGGGVAAGFSGICNPDRRASMSVSSVYDSYSDVPTYSWAVGVVTHEAGHLLGSRHTHACVWNNNASAIDGCAGYVEGTCTLPGLPSIGGTIMSYCHLTATGINFTQGFGAQPAQAIRSQVEAGRCLSSCSTGTTPIALQNHTPMTNIAAAANADQIYKIEVPQGTMALEFNTWGGSGDGDIYVANGVIPGLGSASCQSTSPTTRETCRIDNPAAGTWYLRLHPYSAVNTVNLNASYASRCAGNTTLGLLQTPGTSNGLISAYLSRNAGTHRGISNHASNGNFGLDLLTWNGSAWIRAAATNASGPTQTVEYAGAPAWYQWQLHSETGIGGYSLCQIHPD